MSTCFVRFIPNAQVHSFAAALLLLLGACGGGNSVATDPGSLNLLGGYTGSYSLSFSNPGEQFSESDRYIHVSIQQVSGNKVSGIVRLQPTTSGPLSGILSGPSSLTITQFGDATVGTRDLVSPVSDRCDAGSAVISQLTGGMPDGITLTLTGTVTVPCRYPSGTYSTVANLKIVVPKQYDDPCGTGPVAPLPQGAVFRSPAC